MCHCRVKFDQEMCNSSCYDSITPEKTIEISRI